MRRPYDLKFTSSQGDVARMAGSTHRVVGMLHIIRLAAGASMAAVIEGHISTRDGRQLFTERAGRGTPVVVFEAGMGASRNMWAAVVPLVAERTSTVVYD